LAAAAWAMVAVGGKAMGKRQRPDGEEPGAKRPKAEVKYGEDLDPVVRQEVVDAIIAILTEDSGNKGYTMGSMISKALSSSQEIKDSAETTKQAYGGKGWLVRLLEGEPQVQRVTIPGRDEPCFQLAIMSGAHDLYVGGPPAPQGGPRDALSRAMLGDGDAAGEAKGKNKNASKGCFNCGSEDHLARDCPLPRDEARGGRPPRESNPNARPPMAEDIVSVMPTADAPVPLPVELHEPAASLVMKCTELLDDVPYMEGNRISKVLMDEFPAESQRVKTALDNKGWLKKLLSGEPGINQVVVAGRDEPCYARAESTAGMPRAARVAGTRGGGAPSSKGKGGGNNASIGGWGGGGKADGKGCGKDPYGQFGGKGGMGGKGGGWGKAGGGGGYDAYGMMGMDPYMAEMVQMAKAMWSGKGMDYGMMGKGNYGNDYGKGKSGGFDGGKGKSKGKMVEPRGKAGEARDNKSSSQKPIDPHKIEAVAISRATLCQSAVEILMSLNEQGKTEDGYVEGNRLRGQLAELHPNEIEEVKEAYSGKGWLKKLFQEDPAIEEGRAPGKDEPCYRLRL